MLEQCRAQWGDPPLGDVMARAGQIAPGRAQRVLALMEDLLGSSEVLGASNFCSQLTRINYRYWKSLFHPASGGVKSDRPVPDLIYLDIETLVTQTLLRYHLKSGSLIQRFMFDSSLHPLITKHFEGVPGAFSKEKDWGTFLFWGLDDKAHRVRLFLDGNFLVSHTKDIRIELTPTSIEAALKAKAIFPSMMLAYLVVSLYYGIKCLGGFCQVHDLTVGKEAWRAMLIEMGEMAEAEAIVPVQTKELGGDGLVLAYTRTASGSLVPAMGFDLLLEEKSTNFDRYSELSKQVTLQEMMNSMLPEMYTVLYTETERDPALLRFSPEQIMTATGLMKRLDSEYA